MRRNDMFWFYVFLGVVVVLALCACLLMAGFATLIHHARTPMPDWAPAGWRPPGEEQPLEALPLMNVRA